MTVRPLHVWLTVLVLLGYAPPASAQDEAGLSVESRPPRAFGYFIGDRLVYAGTIETPPGFAIDDASRPRPRDLDYWLDLDGVEIVGSDGASGPRFDIVLTYQTFYVPLEPKEMRIPPVTIGFVRAGDGARREAVLPGFTFVTSPIRPILQRSSPETMQPDAGLAVVDTRMAQWRTGAAMAACLALLGALAAYRGWRPFASKTRRPLGEAHRAIARLRPEASPAVYGEALLALHRGLDATLGRRLLADDLAVFIEEKPRFSEAQGELGRFFAASRTLFFSADEAGAAAILPPADLSRTSRRLAAIERVPS